MKIYFGHNSNDDDRVSMALKDRGISLLRAAPTEIKLLGLFRVRQPGYEMYSSNLPAFMRATELNKRLAISGQAFPVSVKMDDMLPIRLPSVFMLLNKGKTPDDVITSGKWTTFAPKKDKTGFLVDFNREMLSTQSNKFISSDSFAPGQAARYCDVPAMITIIRIFSSFLRTHQFPAFADEEHFEAINREEQISNLNLHYPDEQLDDRARKIQRTNPADGEAYGYLETNYASKSDKDKLKIRFQSAKPSAVSKSWGSSDEIPTTHGIHFPYVHDLSKPDKDTVPRVIERYFLRALSTDTEKCLKTYGEVVTAWKTSLFSTPWGHEISHLARVIELGIPSQSRIFPIVDAKCYFGSFLSGAGFSIALGKQIFRPDNYQTCKQETSVYSENSALVTELITLLETIDVSTESSDEVKKAAKISVRSIRKTLDDLYSFGPETQKEICKIVSRLRFSQVYRVSNAQNMIWMMQGIQQGDEPDIHEPMYPMDMFCTDIMISHLSAFGPNTPSPNLPGAPIMKLQNKLPDKFNKVLGIRLVDATTAQSEWRKSLSSGQITNGVENLSAKFEHSTISGKEMKETWFDTLVKTSEWYKQEGLKNVKIGQNVQGESDDSVVINVGEGFDFGGF